MSTAGFVEVAVDGHPAWPAGASARWKRVGPSQPVLQIYYESDDGDAGVWQVVGCGPAGESPALATPVDDSSAGVSLLVTGGVWGLRLRREVAGQVLTSAEAYLLIAPDDRAEATAPAE